MIFQLFSCKICGIAYRVYSSEQSAWEMRPSLIREQSGSDYIPRAAIPHYVTATSCRTSDTNRHKYTCYLLAVYPGLATG